jgi:ankyrin repeat protein
VAATVKHVDKLVVDAVGRTSAEREAAEKELVRATAAFEEIKRKITPTPPPTSQTPRHKAHERKVVAFDPSAQPLPPSLPLPPPPTAPAPAPTMVASPAAPVAHGRVTMPAISESSPGSPRRLEDQMIATPAMARALWEHARRLQDQLQVQQGSVGRDDGWHGCGGDGDNSRAGRSFSRMGAKAWATLLVESSPAQGGAGSMRHDRLKYDRYLTSLTETVSAEPIESPNGRYRVHVSVERAPEAIAVVGGASSRRYGAFEVYLAVHFDHPLVHRQSALMGLFSKLLTRRWPNVEAMKRRLAEALRPIFDSWADAECEVARLRVALKVGTMRWRRRLALRAEQRRVGEVAIAHYQHDQRHVRAALRRFHSAVLFDQTLGHMREALDRKTALTLALMRFRVGIHIGKRRRTIEREWLHALAEIAPRLKRARQTESRHTRLVGALLGWQRGAFCHRQWRLLLSRSVVTWATMARLWREEVAAYLVTERRVSRQRLLVGYGALAAACLEERRRDQAVRRATRLATSFAAEARRERLVRGWRCWANHARDERGSQLTRQYELLRVAAKDGAVGVLDGLLRAGAKVNACDASDHATALMLCAQNGHVGAAERLIAAGADVNAVMDGGWTALTLACDNGHGGVARVLLSHGNAEVDAKLDSGWTALMLASARGHRDAALALLDAKADANLRAHESHETALTAACRGGHTAIAQLLVEHGADVHAKTLEGRTPWELAEAYRKLELVQTLGTPGKKPLGQKGGGGDDSGAGVGIGGGASSKDDVDSETRTTTLAAVRAIMQHADSDGGVGQRALKLAAAKGQLSLCEALIEAGANVDGRDEAEEEPTALMLSARHGHAKVAERLLASGASPNASMRGGRTALSLTAEAGHLEVVRHLLVARADANARMDNGWTALMLASARGHRDAALALLDAKADANLRARESHETALTAACRRGQVGVARLLIERGGAIIEAETASGQTARQLAEEHESDVMRLLRQPDEAAKAVTQQKAARAASASRKGGGAGDLVRLMMAAGDEEGLLSGLSTGGRALRAAAEEGSSSVVEALLQAGVVADERDELEDPTALMLACQEGHQSCVSLLLDAGADATLLMAGGWSPLMLACNGGHVHAVRLLLARQAAVNSRLHSGWTALILACAHGHVDIVLALQAAGADLNAKAKGTWETALTASVRSGHVHVAGALAESPQCKLDAATVDGRTALDLAEDEGRTAIVSLLRAAMEGRGMRVSPEGARQRSAEATAKAAASQAQKKPAEPKGAKLWKQARRRWQAQQVVSRTAQDDAAAKEMQVAEIEAAAARALAERGDGEATTTADTSRRRWTLGGRKAVARGAAGPGLDDAEGDAEGAEAM